MPGELVGNPDKRFLMHHVLGRGWNISCSCVFFWRFGLPAVGASEVDRSHFLVIAHSEVSPSKWWKTHASPRRRLGIIIPSGAVIITSRNKIADKEDVVESDDNSGNAHLTIMQSSSVQRNYFEERPSALHPLPDAPLATVYSLRVQHVHRTYYRTSHSTNKEIILCSSCRALVDAD